MNWKRKGSRPAGSYERLVETGDRCTVPKGHVPVLVGSGGSMERIVVPVRLFKVPCIAMLLDMAAEEFGHPQEGILRIPCGADHFRDVVDVVSKISR